MENKYYGQKKFYGYSAQIYNAQKFLDELNV